MNVATMAQEHGQRVVTALLPLTKPQLLKPLQHSQRCPGTRMELQSPTHTWMLGSPDTGPTAPTTDWNRDDEVFREGKGTMHWIQDRNIVVKLSLLVK